MKKAFVLIFALLALMVLVTTPAFATTDDAFVVKTITGTGSAINVSVGFQPRKVVCYNPNDAGSLYPTVTYLKDMGATKEIKTLKTVDSASTGNASSNLLTTNGISTYAGDTGMKALSAGTVSVTAGSSILTGSSTVFTTDLLVGDTVNVNGQLMVIISITSATVANATTLANVTASGLTVYRVNPRQGGFIVGTDGDLNVSGEVIFCEAWR